MCLEFLLETDYRGIPHASDATSFDRAEFARRVADRFGLRGDIIPVKTAEVSLAVARPLRGGLLTHAAPLLRNRPLPINEALASFTTNGDDGRWPAQRPPR